MSILDLPRVYFKGNVSWDPVTTNNNLPNPNWSAGYDEDAAESMLTSANVTGANVQAFRQAAINDVANGSWNPAGSYRSNFYDVQVSGTDRGGGLDLNDPLVGAPVGFAGMLVDCEPYGPLSSQLFFDDMSFGIPGGCRIYGKRVTRFTDRYVNFGANPNNAMIAGRASVVWQTCFDKRLGLEIDAFDSAVLGDLGAALTDPGVRGLMVRFVTYRTIYYNDPELSDGKPTSAALALAQRTLIDKLNAGGFQPNPARSMLVGTVGLWRNGESSGEPSERALLPVTATQFPLGSPGAAWAKLDHNRLSIDLSNCIPWADRVPNKVQWGDLTVTARSANGGANVVTVATIPQAAYQQAAYEATSGLIDLTIDPGIAADLGVMNLQLVAGVTPVLNEQALRAIPDDHNLYVNQGGDSIIGVQVYDRGVPAGRDIDVRMSPLKTPSEQELSAVTDGNGRVGYVMGAMAPEVTGYMFQVDRLPIPTPPSEMEFNQQLNTYMYFRVLPQDVAIAQLDPTWDNVYNHVLAGWQAMAPCMDNWLQLDNQAQVVAYGPLIRKLTDPGAFENFRYMPVTRDLSMGKRYLLYSFLAAQGVRVEGQFDKGGLGTNPSESAQPTAPEASSLNSTMRAG